MISPAPYILNGVDGSIISVAQQLHIATLDHRNYHHHHHHFLQHINQYNDHNLNHNPIQNLHSPHQLRYARCYDNQSVSPLYSPTKSHNTIMHDDDIPSAFVRTPILRLPSAADTFHHATDMVKKCDQKFTTKQPEEIAPRKSFALENLIESGASTPSNEPNMAENPMRKRHLFRIDDILTHICASKQPKLDYVDERNVAHFRHSHSAIIPPAPMTTAMQNDNTTTMLSVDTTQIIQNSASATPEKEESVHPPSPSELSSVNAEAPRSCPSDGVPLLMVADPPLPGDLCYLNKTSENRHLSEMDGDSTDAVVVVDMDALPCLDAVAEQTDVSEERPETPLTPSLDPEFLRRLEEEDMPRRVLRSSTIASTEHSKHHAAQRSAAAAASSRHKTASLSSSHSTNNTNNAISPRKRNPQSRAANRTPKKQTTAAPASSGIQYDPIEVKISDDVITPCAPSSSGLSSVSSVSSCASYRSKGSRKKRRIRIDKSNWKPVCSGSRQYVYFTNDVSPVKRVCYKAVRHVREPETLHVRDSVVVKALDGTCNYGKVTRIFLDEDSGSLMASVLWYYNRDQIETDPALINPPIAEKELFASRHIDVVPLDTIEEIIFVITFNEYARGRPSHVVRHHGDLVLGGGGGNDGLPDHQKGYMAENKVDCLPRAQRPREEDEVWSKGEMGYPRRSLLPCEDTPIELVYFCRRLYDFKQKKITTNKPITSRKLLTARRCSSHRNSY